MYSELDRLYKEYKGNLKLLGALKESNKGKLDNYVDYLSGYYKRQIKEIERVRKLTVSEILENKAIALYVAVCNKVTNKREYGIYLRDNLKYLDYLQVRYVLSELHNIEL